MENPVDHIYKKSSYTNAFKQTSDPSKMLDKFTIAAPTLNPILNVGTTKTSSNNYVNPNYTYLLNDINTHPTNKNATIIVAPVLATKASSNNYVNPNYTYSLNDINTHPTNKNATTIPSSLPILITTLSTLTPLSISPSRNNVNNSRSTSGIFIMTASVTCAFVCVVIMCIYTIYRLRVHNKKIKNVKTAVYNHYQYYLEENISSKNPLFKNRGTNSTFDTVSTFDAKIITHSVLEQEKNVSPSLLSVRLPIKHSRLLQLGVERNQINNCVQLNNDLNSRSSASSYSTLTSHGSFRHTGTNTSERFNRIDNYPYYKNNIYNYNTNKSNQSDQIYCNMNRPNRNHTNCLFSQESSFNEPLSMNQFFDTASAPVTSLYNITTTTNASSYPHHHYIASRNHNNCDFDEESSVGEPFTIEQLFDGSVGTTNLNYENTSKEKYNDNFCHVELSEIYPNRGSIFQV